jgi:excinuclease UvrABC nuclease subunit
MAKQKQIIRIGDIVIAWSEWFPWRRFQEDARQKGLTVPKASGVYEARVVNSRKRLTIGKATNLRHRVKQGLVKGLSPHSTGKRIRAKEKLDRIQIRWAETKRQSATEEELHKQYKRKFNSLPKYVLNT